MAPENNLSARVHLHCLDYISGDLAPSKADRQLDVTDLDLPSEQFDLVLCNHVLEHVPDDLKANTLALNPEEQLFCVVKDK